MKKHILKALAATALSIGGLAMAQSTVTFWHIFDSGDALDFMNEVVDDFNAENPDIIVQHLGTNFWDYWTRLTTAMAAGTGPDVALNDLGNVASRASMGVIAPLDDLMSAYGVQLDEFWAASHPMLQHDGSVYALPFETDVRALYYNRAHFEEVGLDPDSPPTTWAELSEYNDLLTTSLDNGRLTRVGFNPTWGNLGFHVWAWLNGAEFEAEDGSLVLNSDEAVEALDVMMDMVNRYGQREMSAFSASFGSGATDPFITGQVSMIAENNTFAANLRRFAPDLDWGVTQLPHNGTPGSWSNGFSIELSASSDNQEAAWRFLNYLMSAEVQAAYAERNGSMVGNEAAARSDELMADPVWATMVDMMGISRFRPFSMEAPTWYDTALQAEVDAALLGRKDAQQALDDAQANYEAEVQRYLNTQ